MTAVVFYRQLLKEVSVPLDDIAAARAARDDLGSAAVRILRSWNLPGATFFATGALAAGTQIAPLHDVDLMIRANSVRPSWREAPRRVLEDLCAGMRAAGHPCEPSTHAVRVRLPGERFTADVVFGYTHPQQGVWIPHCPDDEPARWIRSDPRRHRDQVKERNRLLGVEFAREIRILKQLNVRWSLADPDGRKPLSSFHLTALALDLITRPVDHATTTPAFLAAAATRVLVPLADPAGVGPPLEARDPVHASTLLAEAARATSDALAAGDHAGEILRGVFGVPAIVNGIVSGRRARVVAGGALAVGETGRAVGMGRSYGDRAS